MNYISITYMVKFFAHSSGSAHLFLMSLILLVIHHIIDRVNYCFGWVYRT